MRIAIVGTGIAGLVSAHLLHADHDITVFEADTRVGGHANTVHVEADGVAHDVDTGFIVYNDRNYPGFVALLRELGVATQPSEMSFGVADPETGFEFRASNLNSIFAQRRNALDPHVLRLLVDIVRFNRAAAQARARRAPLVGCRSPPGPRPRRRRRRRVGRRIPAPRPILRRIRPPLPRPVRRVHLVGRSRDVHAVPDAFLRAVHGQPRPARPGQTTPVAHDRRGLAPVRRRAGAPLRRPDPARVARAQDRRERRQSCRRRGCRGALRPRTRIVRPRCRRNPQRSGAADARRAHCRGAFDPRCDLLSSQRGHAAHRRSDVAPQPARPPRAGTTPSSRVVAARRSRTG